jgi:hypothetical protein
LGFGDPIESFVFLEESSQRKALGAILGDKAPIEVGEAKKGLKLSEVLRCWLGGDGFDLVWVHPDSLNANNIAKKLHLFNIKATLLKFDE